MENIKNHNKDIKNSTIHYVLHRIKIFSSIDITLQFTGFALKDYLHFEHFSLKFL